MIYQNHQADDIDEAEVAACLAAICEFLRIANQAKSVKPQSSLSLWGQANLLEAAGLGRNLNQPTACGESRLWQMTARAATFLWLISIVWSSVTGIPSSADQPPVYQAPGTSRAKFVRVELVRPSGGMSFDFPDGASVSRYANGQPVAKLPAQSGWTVTAGHQQLCFQECRGQSKATFFDTSSISRVSYAPPNLPDLNSCTASRFSLPVRAIFRDRAAVADNVSGGSARPAASAASTFMPRGWQNFRGETRIASVLNPNPGLVDQPVFESTQGYLLIPESANGLIAVNGNLYRGAILLQYSTGQCPKIRAINIVGLEDYLLSVVPAEMPSRWPLESLKAQAVCARSYALANLGKHDQEGYDLKSTTEDQVYSGVISECEATNLAVVQTQGLVLKHQGAIVPAFFHSGAGGFTELSEHVWSMPLDFVHSVPDYDDASPLFTWSRLITTEDVSRQLRRTGVNLGDVLFIRPLSFTHANHCLDILVEGDQGAAIVSGETLRRTLNLPSSIFNVGYGDHAYQFAGRGFGHGLGLSQWGAKALAEHGYNAAQILAYYYKAVSLDYH